MKNKISLDVEDIARNIISDGKISEPDPTTPPWVNHIAWEVDTREELEAAADRLKVANVEFLGPTDHGWLHSIYFFDPNDIRLEICWRAQTGQVMEDFQAAARGFLALGLGRQTIALAIQPGKLDPLL